MYPAIGVKGNELCNEPLVSAGVHSAVVHSSLDILILARDKCIFSLQTSLKGKVCFYLPVLPWQYKTVTTQACSE